MAGDIEKRGSGGLRVVDGLVLVVVGVIGVVVAFWILSAVAGIVWGLIKIVILVALVVGVLWLLVGRRKS
ncbi:MAG TPA: hypothetical protein VHW47_01165 [Acidimicrobiales bacterium]|jgi:hypothetical protein|nr:hypothetical protein [Acidimicrobiales bacterium]